VREFFELLKKLGSEKPVPMNPRNNAIVAVHTVVNVTLTRLSYTVEYFILTEVIQ
jgi:hypothetical protein